MTIVERRMMPSFADVKSAITERGRVPSEENKDEYGYCVYF